MPPNVNYVVHAQSEVGFILLIPKLRITLKKIKTSRPWHFALTVFYCILTVFMIFLQFQFLQVDKASTFTVSYNGAKGTLNACVRTPSGSHDDCFVQEMDEGLYGLRFIPKENGVHYLDIKLNDHHIPDSPFAIMVGSMAADPAMVLAHGDGLERGSCGIKPTKIPPRGNLTLPPKTIFTSIY